MATVAAANYCAAMSINSVNEYEVRAQQAEESPVPIFLKLGRAVVWFVYAAVVAIVVILMLAFVLRLTGASTDAAFTRWVYRNSESAMRPFRGIFPVKELGEVSVLDASLLFGAVFYMILALGIDTLYQWVTQRLRRQEADTAEARAQANAVRLQYEAQQQQAANAAAQQLAAQQFATEQRAAQQRAAETLAPPS